jgi:hypothetical protein
VALFLRLQTQWTTSSGGFIGLNYSSVAFLFKIEGTKDQRQALADLQIMEFAALRILNAKD